MERAGQARYRAPKMPATKNEKNMICQHRKEKCNERKNVVTKGKCNDGRVNVIIRGEM